MGRSNELEALISLVDDQDESIYLQIRSKILSYGVEAVPFLEEAWENKDFGEEFQSRIEEIIHEIQFSDVTEGLRKWCQQGGQNLLTAVLLLNKHQFPELDILKVKHKLEDIAAIIKSSLKEGFSIQQKVLLMNRGIFAHFKFKGDNEDYYSHYNSILSSVLERKKGNPLMMSILYIEVARLLNIEVVGVNLPRHFIVGIPQANSKEMLYLSPFNKGNALELSDLKDYLTRLNLPFEPKYYERCSNIDIIKRIMLNLINSYMKQKKREKVDELNQLYSIIKEF